MTNLLTAILITFSTNVTERIPTHQEWSNQVVPTYEGSFSFPHYAIVQDRDPTNKFVRTIVTKHTVSVTPTSPRTFSTEVSEFWQTPALRTVWEG